MKNMAMRIGLLLVLALSVVPVGNIQAQDGSEFDGMWKIDGEPLVLEIGDGDVILNAIGSEGCIPVFTFTLDGNAVQQEGSTVYTLELDEDVLLIYEDDELFAEADYVESREAACTVEIPESSITAITSLDDLDTLVSEVYAQTSLPGMAVAVIGPQGVIWSAGYGYANVEKGIPASADTPFMLASVTKVFTGTSLMMAWEELGFDLDAPVNDWLPFTVDNPHTEGEAITLRHLATHTSGLLDNWTHYDAVYSDGDSPISLGDFLAGYLVAGGEWYDADDNFGDWMPGEVAVYSNVGAALAGYMMEAITGTPLDDYADAHLFGPLGMTNTHWHLADFPDVDVIAMPYDEDGEPYGHYGFPTWPDGQLRTSVNDIGRFVGAVLNGGELDGVRILQPKTVDAMLEPWLPETDPYQGWFWALGVEPGTAGHSGGDDGVSTNLEIDLNAGLGIVLLTNSDSGDMPLVWDAIAGPIWASAAVLLAQQ